MPATAENPPAASTATAATTADPASTATTTTASATAARASSAGAGTAARAGTVRAPAAVVEERVSARVVTDDPLYRKIPVALRFTAAEPLAVRIVFPPGLSPEGTDNEWVFPRALLEAGLQAPTGTGDVRVWPAGRVQAVVELHSPEGVAVVQFDIASLRRFLRRTYAPVTRPG